MRRASRFCPVTLMLAFALFASPQPGVCQQKPEELPHPGTLGEFRRAIREVADKNHVPGAGIALVSGGELLWCGGVGKADLATNREVGCDTEFRVGSISKSFVALALLKLQQEGKINLQARLADLAPEIPQKNRWESASAVRIVNLLEHTAGFDDMSFAETYNRHDPPDYPLLDLFKRFEEPQQVRWPAGTRFSYSNPGYGIAGYLIEKVSGEPFDAYIRQNLLLPLGITVGDFQLTDRNRSQLAAGYTDNPPRAIPYKNIYLRPAGDLKASPGELAKLVQFFLRRGVAGETQLLPPETIARMEYPETPSSARNGLRLGYGLANYTETLGRVVTHGHDGGIDGFLSSYRYMPEQNWGYVILVNSVVSGPALLEMNRLAVDFLSRDLPKPQQTPVPLSAEELGSFAGYYAPEAPRSKLLAFTEELAGGTFVRVREGRLESSGLAGKGTFLVPVGKNLFRQEDEPEATSLFFREPDGSLIYVRAGIDGAPYERRVSPVWFYIRLGLLLGSLVLMLSSVGYAIVWVLLLAFGKLKGSRHLKVRLLPLLAALVLVALWFSFTRAMNQAGELDLWAVLVCAETLLFALLSVAGLVSALAVPRTEIHPGVRIHSLLVALACSVVTLFFAAWHLIGLRLWAV